METKRITDMAELILDSVNGVSAKEFNDIVTAKGRQLFGEFYFYAADYDKKVGGGRYVIARRPIKNLAHVLFDDRNFYFQNGQTYYLIEGGRRLTISQELPKDYHNIEAADFVVDGKDKKGKKKKLEQLKFSVSTKTILPYVAIFGVVFAAAMFAVVMMRNELVDIEKQTAIKKAQAPKVVEQKVVLPDFSAKITSVAAEVVEDGYISKIELSGKDKLKFYIECNDEETAYKLADRVKGEFKDGKVQFVR